MNATQLAELKRLIPDELVMQLAEAFKGDPTFRESFISDPKGAYHRRCKELLPNEEITTETRSDGSRCLCLPRLDARLVVSSTSDELFDEELELVAGGTGSNPFRNMFGSDKGAGDVKPGQRPAIA